MTVLRYRADIDGIRAISIICVVVYHAFPKYFSGGFLGVDIFFVISGYLITTIILHKENEKKFSILEFYSSRILRIFPTLVFVLISILILGNIILLSEDLFSLAKHITRASLFTSNFLLLRESGYFDTSAELKPLLHLWSLSIEEQFYLVFPILIITLKKTIHVKLITTILVLSFFYNIFWINYSPKEVFYLPYTRIWEILVGVLLAWMTNANKPIKSLIPENLLSVIGIILILFGLFIFNKDTQYPSYYATLPVLGTGLLIFAGQNSYINKKLLSINILVYIGLISFPWYLWHWPLLSIFQIIYGERPPSIVIILIVLVSLFLAILSYHFLEKPIRSSSSPSRKKFIFILLTLMALLSMISYWIKSQDGIPNRFPEVEEKLNILQWPESLNNTKNCRENYPSKQYCQIGSPDKIVSAVLIGDSHANHFFPGLNKWWESKDKGALINLGRSQCGVFIAVELGRPELQCYQDMKLVFDYVLENKNIKTVFIAFYHDGYFDPTLKFYDRYESIKNNNIYTNIKDSLTRTIQAFEKEGKKVVLIYDLPNINLDPKTEIKRCFYAQLFGWKSHCKMEEFRFEYTRSYTLYEQMISEVKNSTNVIIFKTIDYIGNDFPINKDGKNMYRDMNHLSKDGSLFFSDKYASKILK